MKINKLSWAKRLLHAFIISIGIVTFASTTKAILQFQSLTDEEVIRLGVVVGVGALPLLGVAVICIGLYLGLQGYSKIAPTPKNPTDIKVVYRGQQIGLQQATDLITTVSEEEADDIIKQVEAQNVMAAHSLSRIREGYKQFHKDMDNTSNSDNQSRSK